jgi:hypothetical protein
MKIYILFAVLLLLTESTNTNIVTVAPLSQILNEEAVQPADFTVANAPPIASIITEEEPEEGTPDVVVVEEEQVPE